MSGTSADAIDAVLIDIQPDAIQVCGSLARPMPADIKQKINLLMLPGADHLDLLGETDHQLGHLFADTANQLIDTHALSATDIKAIGSHGQTVRHRPSSPTPFTLQIADPNLVAYQTNITTVADFHRMDMAAGGEGAPLVPAFHQAVFHHPGKNRCVVNIGGIANVTLLPTSGPVTGFDTGPGNGLMDYWCQQHLGQAYDHNGDWAASGKVDEPLLANLLAHPFISSPPPKSTGREDFNGEFLIQVLSGYQGISPEDVQATLAEFTAQSITSALRTNSGLKAIDELYVCGGGALNRHLMNRLARVSGVNVQSTSSVGIDPALVEGAAFGWLAYRTLQRQSGALASVTGATRDTILGAVYQFPSNSVS